MRQTTAIFAGSFDPFTIGHASIVRRGLNVFDTIVIGIGYNEHKKGEWSVEERLKAIRDYWQDTPEVRVEAFKGLTTEFARHIGADALLRGIRSVADFEYERNLADINRTLIGIETVFINTLPQHSFISSSMIRELIHNGVDPSPYLAGDFPIK